MPTLKRSVARTQDIQDRMNGRKKELVERQQSSTAVRSPTVGK
jgi:hypothetical protein